MVEHEQYLSDLWRIAHDVPGHDSECMRRVTEHLAHWTECASCSAEAREERLPNAEIAFQAILEKHRNRSDAFPFVEEVRGLPAANIVSRWPLFALLQLLFEKWQWRQRRDREDADASLGERYPFAAMDVSSEELAAAFRS